MTEYEWNSFQREHGYTILTDSSKAYGGMRIFEVFSYIVEEGWDEPDDPKPDGTLLFPDAVDGVPFTEVRADAFRWVSDLRLPEGIRYIGEWAAEGVSRIHQIPSSLEIIDKYAFCGATFLEDTFPEHVEMIGESAFYNCGGLRNIHLYEGLQLIEDYAFASCKDLITVSLPASLISIGESVFGRCSNLQTINLDPGNAELLLINGALIRKCDKTMIAWIPADNTGVYRIPDGIKRIGDGTFWERKEITTVYVPEGVEQIGCDVWKDCKSLEQVFLPDSLESIDPQAFAGCNNLKRVVTSNQSLADAILRRGTDPDFEFYWRKCQAEQ